jgi:threonine dehydrogenase-like Zn-dependent dehydrogenase
VRALVFDGNLELLTDCPIPTAKEGEALLRVRVAGICGTDIEITHGYKGFQGILGHEFVAEVQQSATPDLVGRRVCGEINVGCGHCGVCAAGMPGHCPTRTVVGIQGRDGCFADYLVLPERNLHLVPDELTDAEATMVEPLAAAFQIAEQVDLTGVRSTLVLGDGRLGSLCALVLQALGHDPMVFGRHRSKLDRLAGCGVRTSDNEKELPEQVDLVVEATGAPSGAQMALQRARPRGTVVLKSTVASGTGVDLTPVVVKELNVVGSRCGPFPQALEAMRLGMIDVRPFITDCFSLNDALHAFRRAQEADAIKVLLNIADDPTEQRGAQ